MLRALETPLYYIGIADGVLEISGIVGGMEGKDGIRMGGILVIDDEPAIHKLIKMILEHEGFRVMGHGSGNGPVSTLPGERPDLIILDLMMPDVDGFEILAALKSDEETRDIPVIVLSVRHLPEDMDKARQLGAEYYLTKPFDPRVLVDTVREALRKGVSSSP